MKTPGKGARKKKKVSGREIEQIVRGIGTVSAPDVSKYIGEDGFIHAVAESVRFRNTVNGYSVLTVNISGEAVTAVGIMPEIEEGDSLAFVGRPETDPRYGFQIRVTDYRAELPDSGSDIERYLASGVIKGVGPKTARRIVEEFGEDTVGVIERHHEWLAKIPGITRTRAEEIHEQFMRTADIRTVMAAFRDSFGPSLTMRIFAKFGTGAVRILEEDPFRLADEI
ncbi:MAG: hypothetical protein J6V01_06565, partial [Clostridia bacterium]|nr:hypothetical protein [Clostridia bacterium]